VETAAPGCLVERSSTDFSVPAEPKNSRAWLGRTAVGGCLTQVFTLVPESKSKSTASDRACP